MFSVIQYVSALVYMVFITFHVYYETFRKDHETVLKYRLSESHQYFVKWFGFAWACVFWLSWALPEIKPLESSMFMVLGIAAAPWVLNALYLKYKEWQNK